MENREMLTHQILEIMVEEGLTDVHFEVFEEGLKITHRRYKSTVKAIQIRKIDAFKQLKQMAGFDVTRRGSQTGVFDRIIHAKPYQFRFSAIEQNHHTSGVLRLLNVHEIHDLTMITKEQRVIEKIGKMISLRSGVVLFVGRTGSGKSTSMFYFLNFLTDKMVYTLENPIERINPKWIQIESRNPVDDVVSLLRHDPDIIVLGEIRSSKDIEALINAGLSGHLVISTMHAGSIEQAIRRLFDMGASLEDLKDMLVGVVYQEMSQDSHGEVEVLFDVKDQEEIRKNFPSTRDS